MPGGALTAPLCAQLQDDVRAGHGNALQACVASILARPLETVPNFIEDPDGYAIGIARFCDERMPPGVRFAKVALAEGALPVGHEMPPGSRIIVRGTSPRGEFGHVMVGVVASDGRSVDLDASGTRFGVHDPYPYGGGICPPLVWAGLFRGLKGEFEIATLPTHSIRILASYLTIVDQLQWWFLE